MFKAGKNQQCLKKKSDLKVCIPHLTLSIGTGRVDPDQTPQNVLSGSTLYATHSAALETPVGNDMDLNKFADKYGKDLRCPIIRVNAVKHILLQ